MVRDVTIQCPTRFWTGTSQCSTSPSPAGCNCGGGNTIQPTTGGGAIPTGGAGGTVAPTVTFQQQPHQGILGGTPTGGAGGAAPLQQQPLQGIIGGGMGGQGPPTPPAVAAPAPGGGAATAAQVPAAVQVPAVQQAQQQQQAPPQGGANPYGIRAKLRELARSLTHDELKAELQWQAEVKGDGAKEEQLKQDVLHSQQSLRVFGYMRKGSPLIQMVHTISSFNEMGAPPEVKRKIIGMVGDRSSSGSLPVPVILPASNTWKWHKSLNVCMDPVAGAAFSNLPENKEKLWKPADECVLVNKVLPRFIYLPGSLGEENEDGTQLTCAELNARAAEMTTRTDDPFDVEDVQLILDWGLAASQAQTNDPTSSVLAQEVGAITCTHTPVFKRWQVLRINQTLGEIPAVHQQGVAPVQQAQPQQQQGAVPVLQAQPFAPPNNPVPQVQQGQQTTYQNMTHLFATAIQQGLAGAMQHQQQGAQAVQQTAGGLGVIGKVGKYGPMHWALVKGWAGVTQDAHIPSIWAEWGATTEHRLRQDALLRRMRQWSKKTGYDIDPTVSFDKTAMDAFASLSLNPEPGAPRFAMCDKGMSPLLCMEMTDEDVIAANTRDAARAATEGNRTMAEQLSLTTSDPRPPPRDYESLCLATATYAALNWALFGDFNKHYQKVKELRDTLSAPYVWAQRKQMTPKKCRQYFWGMHVDNRFYYDDINRFHPDKFAGGAIPTFPTSLHMDAVIEAVTRTTEYEHGGYPIRWLALENPPQQQQGQYRRPQQQQVQQYNQQHQQYQYQQPPPPPPPAPVWPNFQQHGSGGNNGGARVPDIAGSNSGSEDKALTHVHPFIARTLHLYYKKFGNRVSLGKILSAINKEMKDLPTLNLQQGKLPCYSHLTGICPMLAGKKKKGCKFEHVNSPAIPNDFANDFCQVIGPGVDYVVRNEVAAPGGGFKRIKTEK